MHYRRVFSLEPEVYQTQENINKVIDNKDFICQTFSKFSFLDQYKDFNEYITKCFKNLGIAMNILYQNKEYAECAKEFSQQNNIIFSNMFIMSKKLFFEYCEYIFSVLFAQHKQIKYNYNDLISVRACGYTAEYLTSIFLMKKMKEKYRFAQFMIRMDITSYIPATKHPINICFSCNNTYAPYLTVAINSLIKNASLNRMYNTYILENGMSSANKDYILNLQTDNVKIEFINLEKILIQENIRLEDFTINKYFSPETYFRFFIPILFKDFQKILYLDCDIAINSDVAELYDTDLDKNWFGVCRNVYSTYDLFNNKITKDGIFLENYFRYTCGIKNPRENLFQAGVMLFNIEELKKIDFLNICMKKLKEIGNPIFVDQDVLNTVAEYKVRFLPLEWNHVWYIQNPEIMKGKLPQNLYREYILARKQPKIIHFAGAIKPWKDRDKVLSEYFWEYVPQTVLDNAVALLHTHKILLLFLRRKLKRNKFFVLFYSKQEKKHFIKNLLYFLKNKRS